MSTHRIMAIDEICQRGSIRDADVERLRLVFAHEPHLSASDADALFRIQNLARVQDSSWSDFFIETMTDYVVRELEPSGYITSAHAGWLMARVSTAGRVRTKIEHDLLLNVIDKARWVPESLLTFALVQIRDAVATGEGPLRADGSIPPGSISLHEIEQIRSLIFAYGTDGPQPITQPEADLLLDIDEALPTEAAPEDMRIRAIWGNLFMKAIANAVLDASGYKCPTREEAVSERLPLAMAKNAGSVLDDYGFNTPEDRALSRLERQRVEIITGEPVVDADPELLAQRIGHHDRMNGKSQRALRTLDILRAAGFNLHPAFEPSQSRITAA